MNRIKIIALGAVPVAAFGMMTMVSANPKIYSPYSFTVFIPAVFISNFDLPDVLFFLACVFPITVGYLLWAFAFVRPTFKISTISRVLASLIILLSLTFNASAYSYGLKYQGELHTRAVLVINAVFVFVLIAILWKNSKEPTLYNSAGFSVVLFTWLSWIAFPYLGETI